jgi:pSer/pThr/pTyr-binding forkhead associated (FHA) protein
MTVVRRFESRTDTFETWDMLQQDCLLERKETPTATSAIPGGGLLKRLQQVSQSSPTRPGRPQITSTPMPDPSAVHQPQPVAQTREAHIPAAPETACGLVVLNSQRLIRLPDAGDVVLGRYDRGFSNPPDIDLAYDDGLVSSVSRRHALIIGRGAQHWIEDMGSANGTYRNGYPVNLGESIPLEAGDRLLLGRCRLVYSPLPDWVRDPDLRRPHHVSLVITHTAHRLALPNKREITIGRPDPTLGYVPDIDLDIAQDTAAYVSRRHARLIERGGRHFLEEMGSHAGTRVNGRPLYVKDAPLLLHPGDQIWLGGCVLAYEWKPL